MFLPGSLGRQFSLLDTPLADLLPVVLDEAQPGGWGSRTPGHFELTEGGRRSLLTNLADTPDGNLEVWDDLPGFQWYAPVVRAKGGTEVLAVHKDVANPHGRLPLLGSLSVDPARPAPGPGGNSAFRLGSVWGRFGVSPELAAAVAQASGPVLLVDDLVDSRWTLTVAARELRLAGAAAVLPFALASVG